MTADVDTRAEALLSGPRGRALCAAAAGLDAHRLLSALVRPVSTVTLRSVEEANAGRSGWPPAGWSALSGRDAGPGATVEEVVAGHVAGVDLAALGATEDPWMLLGVLAEAVNDWAFSDDGVAAAALDEAPMRWLPWPQRSPGHREQRGGGLLRPSARNVGLPGPPRVVRRRWPAPPTPCGSTPEPRRPPGLARRTWCRRTAGLAVTTRALPRLPAVQLAICEDSPGGGPVEVWDVDLDPSARVYEVDGPGAWCALVEAHPREVTLSRRHDWWRWTGWEGRWLIPDWAAVAASYDGVHLSVAGHLRTSYRALPVAGGACTCIAGWDPDETIWLTDVLASAKLAARWEGGIGLNLLSG